MLLLFGVAFALTILLTRSSLAKQAKAAWLYPRLAQWTTRRGRAWADNVETLCNCPMCAGTWITAGAAWALRVPLVEAAVSYSMLILFAALYDALVHIPQTGLDNSE